MPMTIHVNCPCGRTLRARPDQAGTAIQCWSCKSELVVPHPDQSARLVRALAEAAAEAFRSPTLLLILAGAVLIAASLMVPRAGPILALALIAASVRAYGAQVRASGRALSLRESATRPLTPVVLSVAAPAPDLEQDVEEPPPWAGLARLLLGVAAALVLAAPILIRNQGHALPPVGANPGVLWLLALALALAGWLLMPVALLAAYAHDRHGPLPPRVVLNSLTRHPAATLAALLVVPLGLLATEALVASFAWEQGQLPLMVADFFPTPHYEWELTRGRLYFDYDGTRVDANLAESTSTVLPVYPLGLRHGFTLVGTIPASLSVGLLEVRQNAWLYEVAPWAYLISRVILTFLILSLSGILFAIQARWLGLVAALDPRRPLAKPVHVTP